MLRQENAVFDVETKLGNIHFSHSIINKIVIEAVEQCDGKAQIYNYKGKVMNVVPDLASKMNLYDEAAGSIEVTSTEESIEIKVYIVLQFGASIRKTTASIIKYIYEYVEKIMGKRPEKVTVVVTGILSKNIARRHIEVSG